MTATVPFKTQLGHDELRTRTHTLGQRHRTILFLIDGRRPLAEVLSLALQAGAATHHFEDLLRLGLVELPPDPSPPAAAPEPSPEPPPEEPAALTSVELVVPADADAQVTTPMPLVEAVPLPMGTPAVLRIEPAFEIEPAPEPVPAAAEAPRPPPPVLHQAVDTPSPDIELPLPDVAQAQLLQQVRELLAEALRLDAPLFSARTFMRVRSAQSSGELIALVWEIEEHLSHQRRNRRELQSLQRARELLGLGNTLVTGDESRPPYLDE